MSDIGAVGSNSNASYEVGKGEESSMEKMIAKQHYSHPEMVNTLVQGFVNSIKMDNKENQQAEKNVKEVYKKGAN
ncbi:MAG: hypothetical protein SP1CHLAM54_18140 [Chlamydiia bacterium]|nr:hypothetical protein [Chlamydiia bacterium]MCH9616700.1 hypothetical protein [Chlamydiia bacterium]MCH9629431.1 hypothetical protein [Chlamydiia bacterium]